MSSLMCERLRHHIVSTFCILAIDYRELLDADSGGKGGGGGGGRGFDVSKAGDTRVGFVGFPSVGKSTLLTKLTGTHSEAAAYEVGEPTPIVFFTFYSPFLFVYSLRESAAIFRVSPVLLLLSFG